MKLHENEQDIKRNLIIEQLEKFNYTDVEGKTTQELIKCLVDAKAVYVDVASSANRWF